MSYFAVNQTSPFSGYSLVYADEFNGTTLPDATHADWDTTLPGNIRTTPRPAQMKIDSIHVYQSAADLAGHAVNGRIAAEKLFGGDGNDRLLVGAGSDTVRGGAGTDSFVFTAATAGAHDVIQDFTPGVDHVDLHVLGLASFADVVAHAADSSVGVAVSAGGETVTFNNLKLAQHHAGDFVF